jgi:cell division protein ZapA
MSRLTVSIFGRDYNLACDDGQEEHLRGLATQISQRMLQLHQKMRHASEPALLVMAALTFADEAHDMRQELTSLRNQLEKAHAESRNGSAVHVEEAIVATLNDIAAHIEALADGAAEESGRQG